MSKIHRSEAIECSNPKCPILTDFTREELESGAPCPICGTKHSEHVCNRLLADLGRAEDDFLKLALLEKHAAMEIDDACVIWAKQELADKPWKTPYVE